MTPRSTSPCLLNHDDSPCKCEKHEKSMIDKTVRRTLLMKKCINHWHCPRARIRSPPTGDWLLLLFKLYRTPCPGLSLEDRRGKPVASRPHSGSYRDWSRTPHPRVSVGHRAVPKPCVGYYCRGSRKTVSAMSCGPLENRRLSYSSQMGYVR